MLVLYLMCQFLQILASYVTLCKKADPEIDRCFIEAIESLRPHLQGGIPQMDVPPIDPFVVPTMTLQSGNGTSFELDLEVTDGIAYGAKDFTVEDAHVNVDEATFNMKLKFKSMNVTGHYKVKGRVMVFHLNTTGRFETNFSKLSLLVFQLSNFVNTK